MLKEFMGVFSEESLWNTMLRRRGNVRTIVGICKELLFKMLGGAGRATLALALGHEMFLFNDFCQKMGFLELLCVFVSVIHLRILLHRFV